MYGHMNIRFTLLALKMVTQNLGRIVGNIVVAKIIFRELSIVTKINW
jgi:hypothetical protein